MCIRDRDSPAEAAGLKEGDIIVAFGGRTIDLSSDLPHVVGRFKAGTTATVEVVREGKSQSLDVVIGELDESTVIQQASSARPQNNRLGVEVRALTNDEKMDLEVSRGVLVTHVGSGPGQLAGIQPGDVLTTINSQWIDGLDTFERLVKELPAGTAIPVRVVRDGQPMFKAVKVLE